MDMQDCDTSKDILVDLGALALGSRLKRLADALCRDATESIAAEKLPIAPHHVPFLACLDRNGPQSIVDLTSALGVSQPAITRTVSALKELALIESRKLETDQRLSIIDLTESGSALVMQMKDDYWKRVETAAAQLFANAKGDFLAQITAVEHALVDESLAQRIAAAPGG